MVSVPWAGGPWWAARGKRSAARRARTRSTSGSPTFMRVMALIAFLISAAESGSGEKASSSAMSVTSSSVSWRPSNSNSGMLPCQGGPLRLAVGRPGWRSWRGGRGIAWLRALLSGRGAAGRGTQGRAPSARAGKTSETFLPRRARLNPRRLSTFPGGAGTRSGPKLRGSPRTGHAGVMPGFDVVLRGGRVVDPESGLDAVRDVAIAGDRVSRIGPGLPPGRLELDVAGQVVTAGFIDMHSHVHDLGSLRLQAMDGVTTALELEAGITPVAARLRGGGRAGRPVNYGFAASWAMARMEALRGVRLGRRPRRAFPAHRRPGLAAGGRPGGGGPRPGPAGGRPRRRRAGHRGPGRLRAGRRPGRVPARRGAGRAGRGADVHALPATSPSSRRER